MSNFRGLIQFLILCLFSLGPAHAAPVLETIVATEDFNTAFSFPLTYRNSQTLRCFDLAQQEYCDLYHDGPTLSRLDGGQFIGEITPNDTYGVRVSAGAPGSGALYLDFNATPYGWSDPQIETDFVSVDLGGIDMQADTIFLEAYDSSSNLLTSSTLGIISGFTGMSTLSLSAEGIDHVVFGTANNSFYYADNISFTAVTQVIPIPAAVWLFGSALAGLGWLRRKQTI